MEKYLHIMTNDKFNSGYIKFIEENFNMDEHLFVFWSGSPESEIAILDRKNIYKVKNIFNKVKLISYLHKYEKIFLHGLHNKRLNKMLYFNKSVLKKCNWIIWGGDLHEYEIPKTTKKEKKKEFYRKEIIKSFGHATTYLEEDFNLLREWYGFKGTTHDCIVYPSNVYSAEKIEKENSKLTIQVGNSAVPRNNHVNIFKKIEEYRGENIEVIVPLSYGNEKYAEEVIVEGKKYFGEKFTPMTELITSVEYSNFLSNVDIAIFDHKKQQAMGNILRLIGFGKKVYLNGEDFITAKMIKKLGLKVYDTREGIELNEIPEKEGLKNSQIIKERFSKKKLKEEWSDIFNG